MVGLPSCLLASARHTAEQAAFNRAAWTGLSNSASGILFTQTTAASSASWGRNESLRYSLDAQLNNLANDLLLEVVCKNFSKFVCHGGLSGDGSHYTKLIG